ncbi:hypothetical protein SAMN05421636_11019 [Pricia antarctica]|uniref:Uncharacterized protein n=1 Tax=Pricia antarctica TaxID=641691 RepID=A0A1G7HR64_9FLAO|nr:hypothetical protein SAMN05421636_11019 [Pricia antarctica]
MKRSLVILLQNGCYYWGYNIFRLYLLMNTFFLKIGFIRLIMAFIGFKYVAYCCNM